MLLWRRSAWRVRRRGFPALLSERSPSSRSSSIPTLCGTRILMTFYIKQNKTSTLCFLKFCIAKGCVDKYVYIVTFHRFFLLSSTLCFISCPNQQNDIYIYTAVWKLLSFGGVFKMTSLIPTRCCIYLLNIVLWNYYNLLFSILLYFKM